MDSVSFPMYIAGGVFRDYTFNKPIRDIDIYIGVPKSISRVGEGNLIGYMIRSLNLRNVQELDGSEYRESDLLGQRGIIKVFSAQSRCGVEINIIFIPNSMTLVDLLGTFTLDISMVGMDLDGMRMSHGFNLSRNEFLIGKNLIPSLCFNPRATENYKDKIMKKYPKAAILNENNFRDVFGVII